MVIGLPEAQLTLAHATVHLATAPKSNAVTTALGAALFAGVAAGIYRDVEEAAASRPTTEGFAPDLSVDRRERAYARWLDAVARAWARANSQTLSARSGSPCSVASSAMISP